MKKIAALLTVYNRKDKTVQCLQNLFSQEGINVIYSIDVYLTDDGCSDGTSETVIGLFPDVNIIKGDGSLFWNRGMFSAWKKAAEKSFDYFLWLNDDTFLYSDSIVRLVKCSQDYPNIILVGSTCDISTKSSITYGGMDKHKNMIYDKKEPKPCYYMHGNIVLIPNYVYEKVGMNDPKYRHSLGDHDYGLMAQKLGINVYVAPGLYGECDRHESISTWKNPNVDLRTRWKAFFSPTGRNPFEFFYYRKKHFGVIPACKSFITNFIHVLFPSLWKHDDYR
ncbi:MAG: glycosyltransferase family 2 protein [Bacteroidales bacterium]|nr:glycosyltransferase family 2 protein [Bacteroidales bacterium]